MEFFQVAMVLGLLPMVVYTAIIWWVDHWEREPLSLVLACFVWGAIPAVVLSVIATALILTTGSASVLYDTGDFDFYMTVILAPLTEESFKGLGLLLLFWVFRRHIDSLLDGILYGAVIGFGFAAVENVMYFISFGQEDKVALSVLVLLRAVAFGLNHAFFTSLTGLGLAVALFQKNLFLKIFYPILGLAQAMFFHGLHNYLVGKGMGGIGLSFVATWLGIFWVFAIIVASLVRQGQWLRRDLSEEVELGVLTAQQAEAACRLGHRMSQGFTLLGTRVTSRRNSRRLDQLCAKLALKKHRLRGAQDERRLRGVVEDLRRELAEVSQELDRA